MFSKNPAEVLRERVLSEGEVADALRVAIMAELDAINLYLQLARLVKDERVRKVFEDVAREEKTHFGEFLALLKAYDAEQAGQLQAGASEVEKLTGVAAGGDPPLDVVRSSALSEEELRAIESRVREAAGGMRRFRKYLSVYQAGPVDTVPLEEVSAGPVLSASRSVVLLREIGVKFSISQRQVEYARSRGEEVYSAVADQAAARLTYEEDSFILNELLANTKVKNFAISSWDAPGSATAEISAAVGLLYGEYVPEPYVLFVSPGRYAKLLAVVERTGVTELARVKSLVRDVAVLPQLKDDVAVLASTHPSVVDVAVGVDTSLTYLGPDDGGHLFLLRETLGLRLKDPRGVLVLRQKPS
ncbi:MAG: family 1 encapsulin nanocompartment shell protein [Pyrobaculum sp.]